MNDRYKVSHTDRPAKNSLFTVGYNKSLNEINQHTSSASNTGINIEVSQLSHEVHWCGSSYELQAGNYHKSASMSDTGLSATLFSFTGKDGLVDKSFVVGPSNFDGSDINRKMHIDPRELLLRIDNEISSYE